MFSRRPTLALLVMMLLLPIASGTAAAEGMDALSNFPPEPEGEWYVYDVADVISNETEAEWEADLRAAHEDSGRLVRLVTVPSMCAFDTYAGQYGDDDNRCWLDWTFDECYDGCNDGFAYEDSYAARMFRAYGMWETDEPSMLIGVSIEDRRFRYVMPDHTTAEQRFSGQQFNLHSGLLTEAADGYGSWEDALEPHVEFGLLVSEGKTTPYSPTVQAALIGGLVVAVLCMMAAFLLTTRGSLLTKHAKNRLALGAYREMAVLIHARLTLDGNFTAMERYRGYVEAIEKRMKAYEGFDGGLRGLPDASSDFDEPIREYEEEELLKAVAEIEACFEEMGLHHSEGRQEVESAVAFEPLEYGHDVEQIHVQIGAISSTWRKLRAPAWLGFVLAAVFVAASFVEQGVAWGSVSPYHFALYVGNVLPLLGGLIPLFIGLVAEGVVVGASLVEDLPERGTTSVDFAALGWPTFGATVAYGYGAVLVGHDEHGSPIYETHRMVSDSGGSSGGGGCGGGGCGGGGCGGGGGF